MSQLDPTAQAGIRRVTPRGGAGGCGCVVLHSEAPRHWPGHCAAAPRPAYHLGPHSLPPPADKAGGQALRQLAVA